MRLMITAQIVDGDGDVIWGYGREEVIILPVCQTAEGVRDVMLDAAKKLLDGLDTAKESVSEQIRIEAANAEAPGA